MLSTILVVSHIHARFHELSIASGKNENVSLTMKHVLEHDIRDCEQCFIFHEESPCISHRKKSYPQANTNEKCP